MTEKFKYGPLVWNHLEDDDESGNYWWPGLAPVKYDETGIPIDEKNLQCLPITCPVHPGYNIKHSVFNSALKEYLPSVDEWQTWFDEHFIEIDEARIKREILRWYAKQNKKSRRFYELQNHVNSLDEMVEAVWPLEDDK
tara:strand:- start:208 stop:624 length:417 start_codon:yes stop_codon:yes gene_type:complete